MKFKVWNWVVIGIMAVVFAAMIVADALCGINAGAITNLLCGNGLRFDGEEVDAALAESDALVRKIGDESIVLLKNEYDGDSAALPLKETERKLNLFGWASCDAGFLLTGGGSGAANLQWDKCVTLSAALRNVTTDEDGATSRTFELNESLLDKYFAFANKREDKQDDTDPVRLIEPDRSFYTDAVMNEAKAFSDVAVITIARWGSENMEIPYTQKKKGKPEDRDRTYLQLSTEEEALIDLVTENFEKVIVIVNTANTMEMGFLDNDKIDAVLLVGLPGQSGAHAIRRVLTGEINPSGRTVDTYAYDLRSAPSYANNRRDGDHIHYVEGIYVGYKWYETAYADKIVHEAYGKTFDYSTDEGYKNIVQYPFGYGLSYTDFTWEVDSSKVVIDENEIDLENASITNKKAKIKIDVTVTNAANGVAGMDVVQLYVTPPYDKNADGGKGGIEKAAVNLVAFAKTPMLEPGQSSTLTLEFDLYDVASYDCYDRNNNGAATYELDAGEYVGKLMNNAHELNACENAQIKFTIPTAIKYKLDIETKQIVKNRFTGNTAYAGVPIDGQTAGSEITYLSRGAFAETFPVTAAPNRGGSNVTKANNYVYDGYDNNDRYNADSEQGVDYGANHLRLWRREDGSAATADDLKGTSGVKLVLNEELVEKLGRNYKASEYEQLLNEITEKELFNLVESSGYRNDEMTSIGKAKNYDYDGPSGLQPNVGTPSGLDKSRWSGFGGQMNLAQTYNVRLAFAMGRTLGNEAQATGISGWYAPGVNLHRTPYNGRYFEYYSEDSVLSGYLGAYVIKGAASANVYCYLKHFALSEMGKNPQNLNVWLTEQALRETYLRPFEICVKKGNANAMMSAFNRIGGTWAGGSRALLTDVLRTEWGFRGVVITDWSSGDKYMNPHQGIRAGNDMWLNPNSANGAPLDHSDNVDVHLARDAAHNMIYTICNTYCQYKDYDPADGEFTVSVGIKEKDKVFAWWIPVLVALNAIVFGVIIFETVWILVKARKRYLAYQSETASETADANADGNVETAEIKQDDIITE